MNRNGNELSIIFLNNDSEVNGGTNSEANLNDTKSDANNDTNSEANNDAKSEANNEININDTNLEINIDSKIDKKNDHVICNFYDSNDSDSPQSFQLKILIFPEE